MDANGVNGFVGNFNWISVTAATSTPTPTATPVVTTSAASSSAAFSGTPISIPGQIEAENFDNGGEGVAYNSPVTYNQGGVYRSTGIGIEQTSDTGGRV